MQNEPFTLQSHIIARIVILNIGVCNDNTLCVDSHVYLRHRKRITDIISVLFYWNTK